jgi:hypothetical protein
MTSTIEKEIETFKETIKWAKSGYQDTFNRITTGNLAHLRGQITYPMNQVSDDFDKLLKSLLADRQSLEDDRNDWMKSWQDAMKEIEELRLMNRQQGAIMKSCLECGNKYEAEIERLTKEKENYCKECEYTERLEHKNKELEAEIETLKSQENPQWQMVRDLKKRIKELEAEIERLKISEGELEKTLKATRAAQDLIVQNFKTINLDEKWKEEHFFAQKKGDYTKPNHCMNCKGNVFIDVPQGWRCKDCLALVWGSDFYQGRNSKAEDDKSLTAADARDKFIKAVEETVEEMYKSEWGCDDEWIIVNDIDKEKFWETMKSKITSKIDLFGRKGVNLSTQSVPSEDGRFAKKGVDIKVNG